MEESTLKFIAAQLRKPEGEGGLEMGRKMNDSNREMNQITIESLRPDAGDFILELGMGNGCFVGDILRKYPSVRYAGCDFSELMVREANEFNQALVDTGKAEFHLAEGTDIPFPDGAVDRIFTVNTIYFWQDIPAVLREFHRLLKNGGSVFLSLRPKKIMEKLPFTQYGFRLYSKSDVITLLTENGFMPGHVLERKESPFELDGKSLAMETLVVSGIKTTS